MAIKLPVWTHGNSVKIFMPCAGHQCECHPYNGLIRCKNEAVIQTEWCSGNLPPLHFCEDCWNIVRHVREDTSYPTISEILVSEQV